MSPDILPLRPVAAAPPPEQVPAPGDLGRLIDRDEFARRLAVGVSTLDRLRAAGKVGPRAVRVGGAVRFRLAEVVAWLSTPDPNGDLYDARSWPTVWAAQQKKAGTAGR